MKLVLMLLLPSFRSLLPELKGSTVTALQRRPYHQLYMANSTCTSINEATETSSEALVAVPLPSLAALPFLVYQLLSLAVAFSLVYYVMNYAVVSGDYRPVGGFFLFFSLTRRWRGREGKTR